MKVLIQFYVTITDVVFSFCLLATREMKGIQLSCLCGALCRCMEVAGSPDYYDLALLELVLKCVVNISSRWVVYNNDNNVYNKGNNDDG